jgi:hypothetical protein
VGTLERGFYSWPDSAASKKALASKRHPRARRLCNRHTPAL